MSEVAHAQRAHAILSASGAHRWMACPPSARLEETVPETTSTYAEEGTFAHELAEVELRKALGEKIRRPAGYRDSPYYTPAMDGYIEEYVTHVMERIAEHWAYDPEPTIRFEQRLDYSRWVPEGFGTGDVVVISNYGIEVIDLKYGQGVPVSAVGNPQLRLYGLGAYDMYHILYDIDRVIMTIVQPRLDNVSTDTMSVTELLTWGEEEVRPAAELAWKGLGELKAGDHCGFCRVKATCRARAEANLALAEADFAFREPELLAVEEVADVLARADPLIRWASDVKEYALDQAENHGVKFPGWKLVEGRSNRTYADEGEVVKTLIDAGYSDEEIHEKKLLGVTKMSKLLKTKRFRELLEEPGLVIKPPGKPVLVPEDDKRPELQSTESAQADFVS